MKPKIHVCWISNAPSPYKVAFMNRLQKSVALHALFETKAEADREKSWYTYDFSGFKAEFISLQNARKVILRSAAENDILINSDYSSIFGQFAVWAFQRLHKPVIMHADGGLAVKRWFADGLICKVMGKNDYFLSSGLETDRYFHYYGIPDKRIFHYHFACMNENELQKAKTARMQKDTLRQKLGLKDGPILFSVGQQIPRKGYDILTRAMIGLEHIELYIAGGKPERSVRALIDQHHLANIHFIGFKTKEELADYYAAADLFVLPTRYDIWGLVINEAMAYGLPIISTDRCVAALHFQALAHNAQIVPSEDVQAMHQAIADLCIDPLRREEMAEDGLRVIQAYSDENMTVDFLAAITTVTGQMI